MSASLQPETAGHAAAHDAHDHDANAPRNYFFVLLALLCLTFITVGASYIQFGSGLVNVVIALTIATIKASLVALFFMHLLHDKPMNAIILVGSFVFLGIFLISCYTDAVTRDPLEPTNLKVQTAPVTPSKVPAAPAPGEHH